MLHRGCGKLHWMEFLGSDGIIMTGKMKEAFEAM